MHLRPPFHPPTAAGYSPPKSYCAIPSCLWVVRCDAPATGERERLTRPRPDAPTWQGDDGTMFRTASTNLGTAKPLSSVEAVELRRRYTQIFLAAGMLISGAANTLTCKQAFLTVSSGHVFNHPFVQAGAMFLGEVWCLVFYLSRMRWRGKRVRWPPRHVLLGFALPALPHGQGRPSWQRQSLDTWLEALALTCTRRPSGPPSSAWADRAPRCGTAVQPLLSPCDTRADRRACLAPQAWCDIIGTSTMYMGLTMTSASTYQMLRGSVVIFTGLMSRVMLRRATAVHQVGVELRVGVRLVHPNVEPDPNPDATPNQWLGMTLVFTGALVVGSC